MASLLKKKLPRDYQQTPNRLNNDQMTGFQMPKAKIMEPPVLDLSHLQGAYII